MAKRSDDAGKALEFIIVHFLQRRFGEKALLKGVTDENQLKDSKKFECLPVDQQEYYILQSKKIVDWLITRFSLGAMPFYIDRLEDFAARKGDITDIRLIQNEKIINLSIKHNHKAVKHQRPRSIAQWCGYEKKSPPDRAFRASYKQVANLFLEKALALKADAITFKEIKDIQKDFIEKELYEEVCLIVKDFITTYCNTEKHVAFLFNFLIGKHDYYKVIVKRDAVEILDFVDIPVPKTVVASIKDVKYVHLHFSNDWEITMRVHTASSKLGDSLKFDSQPTKIDVVEEKL